MMEKVTPKHIEEKINKLSSPDGILTPEELSIIKNLYDKVDDKKGKLKVKRYIENKLQGSTQQDLLSLLEDVEIIKGDFSMETLALNNKSKFLGLFLKKPEFLLGYRMGFILPKVEKNQDLFTNGTNSLELVYWEKITRELGVKSIGGMLQDKVNGFFQKIISTLNDTQDKLSENENDNIFEIFKDIGKAFNSHEETDEAGEKKLLGAMFKIQKYLDFITKDYTNNLNSLIELGEKKDKDGLKKLLDNPTALSYVLENGEYKKDGYNIDLKKGLVSFNPYPDIGKSKEDFMKLVIESNNKSGGFLDSLQKKGKNIISALKQVGVESEDIRGFKDFIKGIPLVGKFLHGIIEFFLSDKLLNLMDGNPWEDKYKSTGKKFQKYVESSKFLPFSIEEKDFEDTIVSVQVEKFLGKVDHFDSLNFENIQHNELLKNPNYKSNDRSILINNNSFWSTIFSEKEPTNTILKQIWEKSNKIKSDNKNTPLNADQFFLELNKDFNIDITPKLTTPQSSSVNIEKDNPNSPQEKIDGNNISNNKDIPSEQATNEDNIAIDSNSESISEQAINTNSTPSSKEEETDLNTNVQDEIAENISSLLENPTSIEDKKLTLNDGITVVFDGTKIIVNGRSFIIKDINTVQTYLIKSFTFTQIYKSSKHKNSFINTLSQLYSKGTSSISIGGQEIIFEEIKA